MLTTTIGNEAMSTVARLLEEEKVTSGTRKEGERKGRVRAVTGTLALFDLRRPPGWIGPLRHLLVRVVSVLGDSVATAGERTREPAGGRCRGGLNITLLDDM
jgi:hypothetical protein